MSAEIGEGHDAPSPIRYDLKDESVRQQLGPSAWKAFRSLMDLWRVPAKQEALLLGLPPDCAALDDSDPAQFSEGRLLRISHLIGIAKALRILYRGEFADQWVNRPNSNAIFGGRTPLAYMVDGGMEALRNVRRLLDSRCAGH